MSFGKKLSLYRWLQICQNSLTMHVFDGKNWISIFWIPYFPVLPWEHGPLCNSVQFCMGNVSLVVEVEAQTGFSEQGWSPLILSMHILSLHLTRISFETQDMASGFLVAISKTVPKGLWGTDSSVLQREENLWCAPPWNPPHWGLTASAMDVGLSVIPFWLYFDFLQQRGGRSDL